MNKKRHGIYWEINPSEGDKTNGLYLGYGLPEPKGNYVYPLNTLERYGEVGDFFDSVRYFSLDTMFPKDGEND